MAALPTWLLALLVVAIGIAGAAVLLDPGAPGPDPVAPGPGDGSGTGPTGPTGPADGGIPTEPQPTDPPPDPAPQRNATGPPATDQAAGGWVFAVRDRQGQAQEGIAVQGWSARHEWTLSSPWLVPTGAWNGSVQAGANLSLRFLVPFPAFPITLTFAGGETLTCDPRAEDVREEAVPWGRATVVAEQGTCTVHLLVEDASAAPGLRWEAQPQGTPPEGAPFAVEASGQASP